MVTMPHEEDSELGLPLTFLDSITNPFTYCRQGTPTFYLVYMNCIYPEKTKFFITCEDKCSLYEIELI